MFPQSEWLRFLKWQQMDVGKEKQIFTAGGSTVWCSQLQKSVYMFLVNLEINLPRDPAILTSGHIPNDSISFYSDTWPSIFIADLFPFPVNWKRLRCVHQLMNRGEICSVFTQRDIIQLIRKLSHKIHMDEARNSHYKWFTTGLCRMLRHK